MAAVKLQVYKLFEKTYGEENAKIIMTFIEENNEKQINDLKSIFLTKEDKVELIKHTNQVRTDLTEQINQFRADLSDRINGTEINLTRRIDSHFKWLVGIMIAIAGLCMTLAKLIH